MTDIANLINRLGHNAMISIGKRTANAKRRMNAKFDEDIRFCEGRSDRIGPDITKKLFRIFLKSMQGPTLSPRSER